MLQPMLGWEHDMLLRVQRMWRNMQLDVEKT
jgi:hypothetical protein